MSSHSWRIGCLVVWIFSISITRAQGACYLPSVCDGEKVMLTPSELKKESTSCDGGCNDCDLKDVEAKYSKVLAEYEALSKRIINCTIRGDGGCFFVKITGANTCNYTEALKICGDDGYVLAVIQDKETLSAVEKTVRNGMPVTPNSAVWLGSTISISTGDVTPPNTYIEWGSDFPKLKEKYTNMHLMVWRNQEKRAIENGQPTIKYLGAVCQLNV